ncbi:MAG: hypothetical protein J0I06_22090 [Planctomycetes bacterium]|nr:hypothetical protein [Planctomycetota bacterium]
MDENLPGIAKIAKLPRSARVAFAARCARRVLPLVKHYWPNAPEHHLKALDRAVSVAENAADAARSAADAAARASAAARAARAADAADAAHAADAAAYAAAALAGDAAYAAAAAAAAYAAYATARRFIARDFKTLVEAAAAGKWTNQTPVPPTVFGPMWPEGVPPDWPLAPDADVLRLRIEIPDGATDEDVKRMVRELVGAMNDVHRASSGSGLQVDNLRLFDTSGVPAGVPQ